MYLLKPKNLHIAKELFEKTIEIDPDYMDAHNNLGNVLKALGECQKAKSFLSESNQNPTKFMQ